MAKISKTRPWHVGFRLAAIVFAAAGIGCIGASVPLTHYFGIDFIGGGGPMFPGGVGYSYLYFGAAGFSLLWSLVAITALAIFWNRSSGIFSAVGIVADFIAAAVCIVTASALGQWLDFNENYSLFICDDYGYELPDSRERCHNSAARKLCKLQQAGIALIALTVVCHGVLFLFNCNGLVNWFNERKQSRNARGKGVHLSELNSA